MLRLALKALLWPEYRRFLGALENPVKAQERTLRHLITLYSRTEYGRNLGITKKMDLADFRAKIPLSDFDDGELAKWIEKQRVYPGKSIIAPGGVEVFEKTSGSSGKEKLIPYNHALKKSFGRYAKIWIYDLIAHGPNLEKYRAFLSVSPGMRSPNDLLTEKGLEDDSQYLSPFFRWVLKHYLTVPLDIKSIQDPDQFRDTLCSYLVADPNLEVVSLWHPSLFLVLWEHINKNRVRIAGMMKKRGVARQRIELLLDEQTPSPEKLWPSVKLVSAWDSANSAVPALQLREVFPGAYFQGKGLLATEAPMTLPLIGIGTVPFITEVFFEFIDDQGEIHGIDGLKEGASYSLLVSQSGGLLRYRMKDRVKVTLSSSCRTPSLEFIGREGDTSDLVGEKLSSAYLASHERDYMRNFGSVPYVFIPVFTPVDGKKPYYVVLSEHVNSAETIVEDPKLGEWWETRLGLSFHYAYARKLEQLAEVRGFRVPQLNQKLLKYFSEVRGMKVGNIKAMTLVNKSDDARDILKDLRMGELQEDSA